METEHPEPVARHRRAARVDSSGGWSKVQVTWPLVALVGVVLAAILGILVWVPASDQQGRAVVMLIVQALVSLVTSLWVARRVENAISDQTNPDDDQAPDDNRARPR